MKKIVITGGLGYIGTELCKIYSGYSWKDSITVIDNRFISERVNQLRNWNIDFIHGDILNKELIKKYCSDIDIVHHLAGITSVPRVKSESSDEHDQLIKKVAEEGTKNILDVIPKKCKIIMPSTHVIYEGINEVRKNIEENESPNPVLSYGKSKFINEKQLKESGKNYIILRLGSVYGYSTDTARVDIMVNFFAKTASQNGILRLFAGGKQIKSLVPLIDVARCFKFMEEKNNISFETFNLTKDTKTVKEVAEICKKINPNITLRETNDEIPNLGFSLSNKKILKTSFKFLYSLEECMKEMITKWSRQNLIKELEYVKDGENEFIDNRGKISNHELTEPINMIGLIHSKKGTIRANHYHPQQEQKCLFTKGQIIEVFQDILNPNSPKITQLVNEGQLSIIKPNVAHAMIFTKDTTFLNLVRGEREHENYGITHTIKHEFVDEQEKKLLLESYKYACRSCANSNLKRVVSLGYQPLANNLIRKKNEKYELYPLELNYCNKCHNCQLSVAVDAKKMFLNYLYTSSTSKIFRKHFEDATKKYISELKLSKKNKIEPKDWNKFILKKETVIIDTRKSFEFKVGTFKGSINPKLNNFREFPEFFNTLKKNQNIGMFCTGGIRCEKASAYLRKKGFKNVYQLKGGIINYLDNVNKKDSLWRGDCFVFDNRVSIKHGLKSGNLKICAGCREPIKLIEIKSSYYEEGVSCSNCYNKLTNLQKQRFRMRQKQTLTAKENGKKYFFQKEA